MTDLLFEKPKPATNKKCKHCKSLIRCEYTHVTIFYCKKRFSYRTENRLLKIRANDSACNMFEQEKKKIDNGGDDE